MVRKLENISMEHDLYLKAGYAIFFKNVLENLVGAKCQNKLLANQQ